MKNNIGPKIIVLVVILIMAIPIITDIINSKVLSTITYDKFESTVTNTSNYGFGLIYVAPASDENIKDKKTEIKELTSKYDSSATEAMSVYYMDSDGLSNSQISEIFGEDSTAKTGYVFLVNGEKLKVVEGSLSESKLTDLIDFYSVQDPANIPDDIKNFKIPEDSKEFTTLAKKKNDVTMFVFGRDSCFYCNQFKLVYNTVIEEYDIEDGIYYIDSDTYDKDEYEKIMDSGLTIPAKCNSAGEDVELQSGFGTPLTLFTKNGKVIDCINGYTNKSSLIAQLKTVGILEAD